jgi:hypothetical protein
MIGIPALSLGSLLLLWAAKTLFSLNRNIAAAKKSGIPYRIARKFITEAPFLIHDSNTILAISGIAGFLWTGIHDPILGLLKSLPFSREWLWPM